LPFSRKLIPAAFPALTTISRVARTEVCAGAIRVSWVMGLPSTVSEIHVVFSARINKVKMMCGFGAATGVAALMAGGLMFRRTLVGSSSGDVSSDAADDAARGRAGAVAGGVVEFASGAAAATLGDDVPDGGVAAGDAGPALSELVEPEGWVAGGVGAEVGGGD
jgi:hypothetical protein